VSPKELLQAVRTDYRANLIKGWGHAFIGRHLDELKVCRSLPQ
jgi:hypothetical protein